MCFLSDLVVKLEEYLTGNAKDSKIIKIHSRRLDELGDLSFPASVNNWKRVLKNPLVPNDDDILTCAHKRLHGDQTQDAVVALITISENWLIKISKCVRRDSHYHVFLDRHKAYENCLVTILKSGNQYGSENKLPCNVTLTIENESDKQFGENLTELRVKYLKLVTANVVRFIGTPKKENDEQKTVEFTLKSGKTTKSNNKIAIYCGPVLNETGVKSTARTTEYVDKRTVDMRLMSLHKYGLRISSEKENEWSQLWKNLGEASVIIELLQNTPSHSTVVNLMNSCIASVKGAPFIMYNGARLHKLLKEFERRVSTKSYPELPDLPHIHFNVLNQPEEWELFYVYILQFPITVHQSICDIENGRVNTHVLIKFLSNMANVFSVYYRRVKILNEPLEHLFDILHARMYLLQSLSHVFHNGMTLLNIKPVTQM